MKRRSILQSNRALFTWRKVPYTKIKDEKENKWITSLGLIYWNPTLTFNRQKWNTVCNHHTDTYRLEWSSPTSPVEFWTVKMKTLRGMGMSTRFYPAHQTPLLKWTMRRDRVKAGFCWGASWVHSTANQRIKKKAEKVSEWDINNNTFFPNVTWK